jgi:hypothetical protein
MTTAEALEIVTFAAASWAEELRQYIAPASEEFEDHESADAQRAQAGEIDAAIRTLTEKETAR